MYIYTESGERLVPAQTNIITLRANNGYIYVDKSTYEQATILNNKYCNDFDGLCKLVGGTNNQELVKFYYNSIPEPMNILAPFIGIIDDSTEFDGSLTELVGCLHVIARSIDFTKFVKIPAEIRNTVTFSDHIRKEFEIQWQEFINECVPYQYIYDVFAKEGTFANAKIPTFAHTVEAPAVTPTVAEVKPTVTSSVPASDITLVGSDATLSAAIANDESLLAALVGEDDTLDTMDLEAELAALGLDPDGHPLEDSAKKTAPATTTTAEPAKQSAPAKQVESVSVPEAESGKDLIDSEWGDI